MKEGRDHQLAATAQQRGAIYGLLSRCYGGEVDGGLLERLKDKGFSQAISAAGFPFDREELHGPIESVLEELAVDYAWLFLGPGVHISPHESVQRPDAEEDGRQFWGTVTGQVKQDIENSGFVYDNAFSGIPDHIGVELEFMHHLCMAEAEAWQNLDPAKARESVCHQKRFLEEHLLIWVPSFCEKVVRRAQMSFYRFIAHLTRDFIFSDHKMIGSCDGRQTQAA
ncbi:MAG: molecular chaperone TorD family protein [Desulfobacteraceae bacterium]